MTKKIILSVLAVAVVAFMSITVYKAWFEPNPPVEVEEDEEEDANESEQEEEVGQTVPPITPSQPIQPSQPPQPTYETCKTCNGTGQCPANCEFGWVVYGEIACPLCNGTGFCNDCKGARIVPVNTNTTP